MRSTASSPYCKDGAFLEVGSFDLHIAEDSPPPAHKDIFATFHFVFMAVPLDWSWENNFYTTDPTNVCHLDYALASVDTAAFQ